MKNITAQYRDLTEGKLSKANFMTNVRRLFPDYISATNNLEDAVSILKSKRILKENDLPKAIRGGMLSEAEDKSEGKYKEVTGKNLYSHSQEIDRVNPYEVKKGIAIEMGMNYLPTPNYFTKHFNPDTLEKATKKVLKNLEKDPAYYTNMISLESEKKSGLFQKPKELKVRPDGKVKVTGFSDTKANTETTLSKKERAKGTPEGVKEMKPSKRSMGGLKTMKANEKLPKGVELMKESTKASKEDKLAKLKEYLKTGVRKALEEDLYKDSKSGKVQSFDPTNVDDAKTLHDPKFSSTFKKI